MAYVWGDCVINGIPTLGCIVPVYRIAISTALSGIGIVSLFFIIFAGIKFTTSGGGKGVEEAKNMLTYAIVGLLIVLLSFFVINTISGFTGVQCIATFSLNGCP